VHSGPLPTPAGVIAPSDKSIDVPSCQVIRVRDGKVASFTHYFDFTLLRQVGAA
jgi:ketosteroid isomerase-like protein